jgi:phenylacetate-CoA ligase
MSGLRRPWEAVDFRRIERSFPPPPEYFETAYFEDPDTIERRQLSRLRDRAQRAAHVPFFRNRWEAAGVGPENLATLDDLWRFPAYTVDDIRRNIEEHPPYGDYQGVTPEMARLEPMRLYMSGGTTGNSRPTLYTQWDREVGAVLTARALYQFGIRPGDVVLNAWAYSTHNGAFSFDEALHRWLNCVVLTTGTGNVTSSRRQIELAREYRATAILTTGDYMLHLAETAREMGLDPRKDFNIRALPNIGDPELLQATWGPEVYQSYGFHEVQWVAFECRARQGLHVMEDAFIIQIVDVETGEPLPDGEQGAICITEIYKTGSPQFRYNIMDLSTLYPRERCVCGSWLRRMAPFAGRGDNMVKLRGVNVWPEALGDVATSQPDVGPDYFVRAIREQNRDEMIVHVTSEAPAEEFEAIQASLEAVLKERFGVRIGARVHPPGALDDWTEINVSPKLKRFRDEREALPRKRGPSRTPLD